MGAITGVWRIHNHFIIRNECISKQFVFNDETLPWLHIQLAYWTSSPKETTFKLNLIFPDTMPALKVKCQLLFVEDEKLTESAAEFILSSNRTSIPILQVIECEILDSIMFIVKYESAEQQKPLAPVTDDSLGSLLSRDSEFTDVVLVSGDNCRFPVHRCALAAHSPVFHAMFASDMSEKQNGIVEMSDLDSEVLHRLLSFVYTNVVADDEVTTTLFVAAEKYAIDALKARCEDVLAERLSAENAVDLLVLADAHGGERLKGRAMDFIAMCGKLVIDSDKFRELKSSNPQLTIETLLAMVRE